ncbi:MAG: cytochrome c5 family protein [Betaproteobacteria bacterium]|nr:cytochrome c5 family protein [Betaproteobacteria bacterium]
MTNQARGKRRMTPCGARVTGVLAVALMVAAGSAAPWRDAGAQAGERSGEQIVKSICAACHETGKNGAPRIGDRDAWIPRLKQGLDQAVHRAIRGHDGMPPRGGKAELTDPEFRSAIVYMINPVGAAAKGAPAGGATQPPARAKADANFRSVGGMDIYLGLMSAETLRGYPKGSPEASMHGGVPRGSGYHHLNISIFDSATNAPVAGARVDAKVEQVGVSSESNVLEPIAIRGAGGYGNYFRMSGRTPYRITVRIRKPGAAQSVEAQFEHRVN